MSLLERIIIKHGKKSLDGKKNLSFQLGLKIAATFAEGQELIFEDLEFAEFVLGT